MLGWMSVPPVPWDDIGTLQGAPASYGTVSTVPLEHQNHHQMACRAGHSWPFHSFDYNDRAPTHATNYN